MSRTLPAPWEVGRVLARRPENVGGRVYNVPWLCAAGHPAI